MLKYVAVFAVFSAACFAQAQGPLTDQRIMELTRSGITQDELARIIATAPSVSFDLTPAAEQQMMQAGVAEATIRAMAARESGQRNPVPAAGAQTAAPAGNRRRVFIEDSPNAWSGKSSYFVRYTYGSHPQRVEVMKTFGQSCSSYVVTNDRNSADYIVMFERESSKVIRRDSKIAVFDRNGDMVYSGSKRALGNAVREFCAR